MVKLSQVQKIIEFLKSNPNQKFTARAIAEAITSQYPEEYQHKRQGFKSEQEFLRQIVAEVGAAKLNSLNKIQILLCKINHAHVYIGIKNKIYNQMLLKSKI